MGVRGDAVAALDGIRTRSSRRKPVDKDLYERPPDELANVPQVPGSLEEVLIALEKGPRVPARGRRLHPGRHRHGIDYKRTQEVDQIRLRPHPYEFQMYFDL